MKNAQNIDVLLKNKEKNDSALAELADALRVKLRRLEEAGMKNCRQQTADSNRFSFYHLWSVISHPSAAACSLPSAIFLLLLGVAMGYCVHIPSFLTQENPPVIRPVTETLEEFVASEARRLLTVNERTTLISVTEKILQQGFSRPSAIEEEFRFQRRLAGIDSPAFNAFSDKWAVKVEEMKFEDSVEAIRSVYLSLLRGLQEAGWEKSGVRRNGRGFMCGFSSAA
jgi:hypothetical protein